MRNWKLNRMIEYLKSVEFYHDTFELEEKGVEGVLADYGILDRMSDVEIQEMKKCLFEMAEQNEFREAVRYAQTVDHWVAEAM